MHLRGSLVVLGTVVAALALGWICVGVPTWFGPSLPGSPLGLVPYLGWGGATAMFYVAVSRYPSSNRASQARLAGIFSVFFAFIFYFWLMFAACSFGSCP